MSEPSRELLLRRDKVKDRRIADLNGLIDMMRENAVDREQRIAELEAENRNFADRLTAYIVERGVADSVRKKLKAERDAFIPHEGGE